jgi:hypothetical protein
MWSNDDGDARAHDDTADTSAVATALGAAGDFDTVFECLLPGVTK